MVNNVHVRGLTAIHRVALSRPVALAVDDGLLGTNGSFFDYGCGRGGDVTNLRSMGIDAVGWDPVHLPDGVRQAADVVNLGYVVNVIENPLERAEVLLNAWQLARRVLVVAARLDWDVKADQTTAFSDGVITSRGTFQRFFTQHELQQWIQETVGIEPDAAAPGVFYVFRNTEDRENHLANISRRRRYRVPSRVPVLALEENRLLLEPLLQFLCEHGRPPARTELPEERDIVERFGSVARAVKVLSRVADVRTWENAALDRQRDLLVYLALGSFRRKPSFGALPSDLRTDIKHFFGSYAAATRLGRDLLFGAGDLRAVSEECANAPLGKLTPEALYVHVSGLTELPVLLRVYEGCARTLLGEVPGATIVKLRRDKPKISYLCYPAFDADAHPPLTESFIADLRALRTHHVNYADRDNPPVLHRKECFVSKDYPLREVFAALTEAEVDAGLLVDAAEIGTQRSWEERLAAKGLTVQGHALVTNN